MLCDGIVDCQIIPSLLHNNSSEPLSVRCISYLKKKKPYDVFVDRMRDYRYIELAFRYIECQKSVEADYPGDL